MTHLNVTGAAVMTRIFGSADETVLNQHSTGGVSARQSPPPGSTMLWAGAP